MNPENPIPSIMSIRGHPIHPMIVHFPIAALLGIIASDLAYLYTQDFFWARVSLWLAGTGALSGAIAGIFGLADMIFVAELRRLITGWCHAILAVMLMSLASLNWLLRLDAPDIAILPWGLYVSVLGGIVLMIATNLGGHLIYEHGVGMGFEEPD